jgi:hypothetical protein
MEQCLLLQDVSQNRSHTTYLIRTRDFQEKVAMIFSACRSRSDLDDCPVLILVAYTL